MHTRGGGAKSAVVNSGLAAKRLPSVLTEITLPEVIHFMSFRTTFQATSTTSRDLLYILPHHYVYHHVQYVCSCVIVKERERDLHITLEGVCSFFQ